MIFVTSIHRLYLDLKSVQDQGGLLDTSRQHVKGRTSLWHGKLKEWKFRTKTQKTQPIKALWKKNKEDDSELKGIHYNDIYTFTHRTLHELKPLGFKNMTYNLTWSTMTTSSSWLISICLCVMKSWCDILTRWLWQVTEQALQTCRVVKPECVFFFSFFSFFLPTETTAPTWSRRTSHASCRTAWKHMWRPSIPPSASGVRNVLLSCKWMEWDS